MLAAADGRASLVIGNEESLNCAEVRVRNAQNPISEREDGRSIPGNRKREVRRRCSDGSEKCPGRQRRGAYWW
ncbi:hypothetical protein C2S53_017921 [Perilla frutescens var. hirtella]|uniref:Uncharacterized protein n=1 Tax=Perilla frutescens var. hirtella TaxID=608512 RepID=A0AAD4J1M5_PERFH|nr:hypothetical protein C2S53_017921 [Perilla frutescens var. hirtella]